MEKLTRKLKTIGIHGKSYVEVKERILALVDSGLPYAVNTEHWYYPERKMWVVKATLTMVDTMESFSGLAQEIEDSSNINKTSALENAETSAVGRACAFAGIGVIDGIASVDEINKAVNRESRQTPQNSTGGTAIDWFNKPQLQECIKADNAFSMEAIEAWAKDNGYRMSGPSRAMSQKYLDTGEL